MDTAKPIHDFTAGIAADPRIRVTHMAVFLAIYQQWLAEGTGGPVCFLGRDMMVASKISSSVTYHRAIRALHEYGYLKYQPSFSKLRGNKVWLKMKNDGNT